MCPGRITLASCVRIVGAIAVALTTVSLPLADAVAVTVRDAAGRMIAVGDASRIVSIGGAVTEILYALGLKDKVVAVDATSLFPLEAMKEKPNVGYFRALSAEGVLGLNPSVVLAIEGAGPKETVSVLESATVPYVRVPDRYTGEGIIDKVRLVADVAGANERGECLSRQIEADLKALSALRTKVAKPAKVLFVLSILNGKPLAAGRNTAADGIIKLAGAVNAIDSYDGYKQITDEAVIAAGPDTVLVMERGRETLDAAAVFSNAAFTMTPAAKAKSFVSMDGLYLLGFGPRTAAAARDLAAKLYPAVAEGKLPSEQAHPDCSK